MTNTEKISPDDPRLTAFALGELEGEELAAVQAALRDNPAARAAVDEIRATAVQLQAALGAEPMLPPAAAHAADPYVKKPGTLLRFPQIYYLAGGLAAAAFAILVTQRTPPVHMRQERKAESRREITLNMPVPTEVGDRAGADRLRADPESKLELDAASDKKRDVSGVAQSAAPTMNEVAKSLPAGREKSLTRSEPREPRNNKAPVSNGLLKESVQAPASAAVADSVSRVPTRDEEVQTMAKLESGAAKDQAFGKVGAVGGKPIETPAIAGQPERQQSSNQLKNAEYRAYIQTNTDGRQYNALPAPAPSASSADATGAMSDPNQIVTMEKFEVQSEKDYGYLKTNSATATRIGMETQRTPLIAGPYGIQPAAPTVEGSGATTSDHLSMAAKAKTPFNTESYAYRTDNDFLGARENPLSTFSVDVDTASYANVRRFLNDGQLPPPDAVRIEEMVNYFPYHYAPPQTSESQMDAINAPFAASMEVAEAPWAPTHRLVRIGLKGREVSTANRSPANLVFLLDVSGSMAQPNKLPLVKASMRLLISRLRNDDRVAIVVYAGASGLALPSTPVAKSREILAALDALAPGGSTNGAMGIQLAYDIAKANFIAGGLNRVILCTDGDFNVGVTGEGDLTRLIEDKAKSGVFLTVLGFGMGNYKDATLEKLADKGNGNYGYIDTRREAEKLLVEQISGTLVTIAKDVKLQVEFNPAHVASYRLIGYENRLLKKEDFNNDAVDAGEIGAGHTVTALYEVVPTSLPIGERMMPKGAVDDLKYRVRENRVSESGNPHTPELLTLKLRYKSPAGEVSRKLEFPLTDGGARFADASEDFKFAAAVAEFGMILRDSPHKGTGTLAEVQEWAEAGRDDDAGGYRGEFIELVQRAKTLLP